MSEPSLESASQDFPVVGIGASAGGITALQVLFKAIPEHPNLAFIVVQHLLPDQPSQLATLMAKWTSLPVREARDEVPLERDCVFIAPPGVTLTLERGVFVTQPLGASELRPGVDTIDRLFESLASELGPRAIAVVLSGWGVDGAAGAIRVREAGGKVFVQDPTTAMHDGMPSAVISSGAADRVMPLGMIAEELVACASPSYTRSTSAVSWSDDATRAVNGIIELILGKTGVDLAGYKRAPLLWAIQRRMISRRVPLFHDYEALLHDDPAELETLVRSIPIHVTCFFRDRDAWHVLERDVVPQLFRDAGNATVRAWTAACATGEEAYSIAMLLAEQAVAMVRPGNFQVFATDAASEIVAQASKGVFKAPVLDSLSPERQHFFYAVDGGYRVKRALREKMVFAPQDLIADPPFAGVDLVTCRNLLIYLEADSAERVIYHLQAALRIGGYLFLGKAESLSLRYRGLEEVVPGSRIYRKLEAASEFDFAFPKRPKRLPQTRSTRSAVEARTHHESVQTGELPAVLVDEQYSILRIYGDTSPLLRFPAGEPKLDLLHLLYPAIRADLIAAVLQARSEQRAVTVSRLEDPTTHAHTLGLRVTPLATPDESGSRILVAFMRGTRQGDRGVDAALEGNTIAWTEALRISHEELESSREELQVLNEELRASNEQLNLANEELNQVNTRLREKIDELETQSNVLSSGAVMTLFLDHELRVRWFTPAMTDLFPLQSSDVGRRISDLAPGFRDSGFLDNVAMVMRTGALHRGEICSMDARWYLQRILPFRAGRGSDADAGVAITFADITDRKNMEAALRESEERQKFLLTLSDALRPLADPTAIKREACRILGEHLGVDRTYYAMFDEARRQVTIEVEHVRGDSSSLRGEHAYDSFESTIATLRAGSAVIVDDTENSPLITASDRPAFRDISVGSFICVPIIKRAELVASMAVNNTGRRHWAAREIALLQEVTQRTWEAVERARAEDALRRSEELYRGLFESIDQGFCIIEVLFDDRDKPVDYRFLTVNPAYERQTGLKGVIGRKISEVVASHQEAWPEIYGAVATTGQPHRFERLDENLNRYYEIYAWRVDAPPQRHVAILFNDISERRRAQ